MMSGLLQQRKKYENGFVTIMNDLQTMPATMKQLAWVQFFSWFALFSMWIYTTTGVTSTKYNMVLGQTKLRQPAMHPQPWDPPPESHRKSSILKPVSKASKNIKTNPKAIKKHKKMIPKSTEFQHMRKVVFCNTSNTKCFILEPRHPEAGPDIIQKPDL